MNNDIGLKITITGDGKSASAEVGQVVQSIKSIDTAAQSATSAAAQMSQSAAKGMADIGRAAQSAKSQVDPFGVALNKSLGFSGASETAAVLSDAGQAAAKAADEVDALNQSIDRSSSSAMNFGRLIAGAFTVTAVTALGKDILQTNMSMETLRMQLVAVTGSTQEATRAFDFIRDFAKDTPFEIDGITKTFLTLQNYGIKPTAEVMSALTDEAAKLGGKQETLTGITLALGQAWSNGKLQGQEILQLVNQGVPIWDLLSQATGKSTAELHKMSESGEIGRDILTKLFAVIGQEAKGSSALAMDTLAGKISNLSDAWHTFEDTLMGDKSEGLIKSIVGSITTELSTLSRNMSSAIDDQIAHAQARIATFNSLGAVGRFVGDMTGYDVNQEKNRIDALNAQKARQQGGFDKSDAAKSAKDAQQKADEAAAAQQTAYWETLVENANEADKAQEEAAKHAKSRTDQSAKQYAAERENIAKTVEQLKFELETMQLSDAERQIQIELRSKTAKATAAEVAQIEDLIRQKAAETEAMTRQQAQWNQAIKDANDYYDLRKEISDLVDSGNLNAGGFNTGIGKIDDLHKAGSISDEQAKAEFDRLSQAYNTGFADPAKEGMQSLSVYADQSARNIQSAFAQFLFDPFGHGLQGMVSSFLKATAQMVANAASANILDSMLGKFGGQTGWLSSLFGGIGSLFGGGTGVSVAAGNSAGFTASMASFPGFAAGGDTPGGYRIVGESGPELEATGPARIYNAQQTQQILSGGQNGSNYTFAPTYQLGGNDGGKQPNVAVLNDRIDAAVRRIIIQEQRPGGILAPS